MQIMNHRLIGDAGHAVAYDPSPNQSGTVTPLYLVIHYTAGTSSASAVSWLKNPASKASAHLVIDRDGSIVQLVPFNRRAWHAGVSQWGQLSGLNHYSIGIELVNAGKLRKRSDGQWLTESKQLIPAADVTVARHQNESESTGWHEYTDVQIATVTAVGQLLNQKYGFTDVLGHDDIAPTRKIDPGPLFPMNSVRGRILGRS